MPKRFGPINPKCPHMLHGGDYNPEQWIDSPEIWDEDMRLMKLAHCNAMSVGIFSWVMLEPEEGKYEFDWLDRVMDNLSANQGYAVLATPSGAKPAWMSAKYPEIRRVLPDGTREPHRGRHNHCYTSPVYRDKITAINTRLAERYKGHDALLVWHVSNEYGGECHCASCWAAFRAWLRKRYETLDALNRAWWSTFWSHRYTDWEQIDALDGSVHGMTLDWKRFVTDQTVDFFCHESAPLRAITPDVPVTINMMGTYPGLNYWKFAPHVDVISWDSYPQWHTDEDDTGMAASIGFLHDINRSLKGGKPFMLMESTPSNTNWQPLGVPKRPGMHRVASLQAVAHGSDTVQYFQWRKSRGSAEKFHGAVVDHVGHENTRVFRSVAEVGQVLEKLDPVVGSTVDAQVALIYDWENRWALEAAAMPRARFKDYQGRCVAHYRPYWTQGIPVDVVHMDADFSAYQLVVAPLLYMVRDGVGERLEAFVRAGGTLVATYMSGMVNETDLCFLKGFPGPLRTVLGIWAEELDVLADHHTQTVVPQGENTLGLKGAYTVQHFADVIHAETAQVLATYSDQYYAGSPALTVNSLGEGEAYYIASRNDERFLRDFHTGLAISLSLRSALEGELPPGVNAQVREDGEHRYVFLLNFAAEPRTVELGAEGFLDVTTGMAVGPSFPLEGYGTTVLQAP